MENNLRINILNISYSRESALAKHPAGNNGKVFPGPPSAKKSKLLLYLVANSCGLKRFCRGFRQQNQEVSGADSSRFSARSSH